MTADMRITAIAPYFGGKRNLAGTIVEELGPHRVYWNPCCGSMPELLIKPPCVMETVNDLYGDLINLARVIQREDLGSQLYRRLRRTLMSEVLHREAAARHHERGYMGDGPADLEAAYDYFLCAWLGRNGVAGTASYNQGFCARFTMNGGHPAVRWCSVMDSIPAWRRRLRNVTIMCRDMFELLPKIDDAAGTAIYIDPPYLRKGAKYIHDFEPQHHRQLADELQRFARARVVVSYYDDPQLVDLYPMDRWTHRKINVSKALACQGSRGKKDSRAVEVLLLNGPSFAPNENGKLF